MRLTRGTILVAQTAHDLVVDSRATSAGFLQVSEQDEAGWWWTSWWWSYATLALFRRWYFARVLTLTWVKQRALPHPLGLLLHVSLASTLNDSLEDTSVMFTWRRIALHARVGARCSSKERNSESLHLGVVLLSK